jgi:hypothetical protein
LNLQEMHRVVVGFSQWKIAWPKFRNF